MHHCKPPGRADALGPASRARNDASRVSPRCPAWPGPRSARRPRQRKARLLDPRLDQPALAGARAGVARQLARGELAPYRLGAPPDALEHHAVVAERRSPAAASRPCRAPSGSRRARRCAEPSLHRCRTPAHGPLPRRTGPAHAAGRTARVASGSSPGVERDEALPLAGAPDHVAGLADETVAARASPASTPVPAAAANTCSTRAPGSSSTNEVIGAPSPRADGICETGTE